jgi:hypothetical protein
VEQIDLHASQSTSLLVTGRLKIIFSNVDENCSMIQARDVVAVLEETTTGSAASERKIFSAHSTNQSAGTGVFKVTCCQSHSPWYRKWWAEVPFPFVPQRRTRCRSNFILQQLIGSNISGLSCLTVCEYKLLRPRPPLWIVGNVLGN